MDKLEKILMPMADVLTKNRVLIAIRDGFLISTPLLIVGSVFLLIANFPICRMGCCSIISTWCRLNRLVQGGISLII